MYRHQIISSLLLWGMLAGATGQTDSGAVPSTVAQPSSGVTSRKAAYPIDDLLLHRWSSRAMSGEAVSLKELQPLFEAARWAPSSYNDQPWVFIYALKGTPEWDVLFNLLVEFNQEWARNAGALVVIASRTTFERGGKPSRTHSFDTGAAWQNFALQGHRAGLVVHGIGGFDYDRAAQALGIPAGYTIEAMAAVAKPGAISQLPEGLQSMEKPSERKPQETFVFKGSFTGASANPEAR